MMRRNLLVLAIPLVAALSLKAETIRCKAVAVNSPSFERSERNLVNQGPNLKIKWWEQFGLVDFDVSALKGKKIKEARLIVKPAGGHAKGFNLNHGTALTWISVTTVSEPWDPRKACANRSGLRDDWGFPGARTYDVACGHGNTLRCNTRLVFKNGRHSAALDVAIVEALVAGASHGIFIMDGSTTFTMNCLIRDPVLEVVTGGTLDATPPTPASEVRAAPAPNWATQKEGALSLTLKAPKDAFSFNVKVDGKAVQRWQIPFARPGKTQTFQIVDQPESKAVRIEVSAVDGCGNVSAPVTVSAKTSPKLTVPRLPASDFTPKQGMPRKLGTARIYAFPELTMVDPVSCKALHEDTNDVSRANAVWDGSSGTVRLAAARAEIASFQLAIEGSINDVKVELSDLKGPDTISNTGVRLWRNWYVKGFSEYALPWKGSISCPMVDNKIKNQKLQALTVDLPIPKSVARGLYRGKVTLTAGNHSTDLDLAVQVYGAVIPDEVFFSPELNCYGGPGKAGSKRFNDSFRLAHYHRATINRVPYSQHGRVHQDWSPDVDQNGRVTDWSRFDENLGPLLDGTLFKDNPRSGVPVASLYLPHFEGWPLSYRDFYKPGCKIPTGSKDGANRVRHHILAKPIEEAMSQAYGKAFVASVRDFYQHADEKRWHRTVFQCYLNNKSRYGYAAWTLDEPNLYRDWEAINYWGRLWKEGINDPAVYSYRWIRSYFEKGLHGLNRGRPTFLYRGDISRIVWQGNLCDDIMNITYLGGGVLNRTRLVKRAKRNIPSIMFSYGSCPKYSSAKWATAAWCLKAFVSECNGVLPWQSLGKGLDNPDPKGVGNRLIVNAGKKHGHAVASFRVHALRRGAQDCELLRLLMLKRGWSRQHIGELVAQKIRLATIYNQGFVDEAAAHKFGKLTARDFHALREGVLKLLDQPAGKYLSER